MYTRQLVVVATFLLCAFPLYTHAALPPVAGPSISSTAPVGAPADSPEKSASACGTQAAAPGQPAAPKQISGKDVGEVIQQLDRTTHDTVVVGADGKVSVKSTCGTPGKLGSVRMCLMSGICVTVEKDEQLSAKIAELQNDPTFKQALSSSNPEEAARLFTKKLFEAKPGLRQQLSGTMKSVLDQAFGASGWTSGLIKGEVQPAADKIINALAAGDFQQVASASNQLAQKLKDSGFLERITNPNEWGGLFEQVAGGKLTPEAKTAFNTLASVACDLTGRDCPQVTPGTGVTGFADSGSVVGRAVETAAQTILGSAPVGAGADGRIDPIAFAQRAAYKVAQSSLNGQAPEALRQFGITTGSPDEWGRFFTMITKQESGLRVAPTNSDGSLQRFSSTLPGENSFGPGQFNIGEYGLRTWQDVNNPDRVIDAYIKVAEQGKLFQYFGSLQRPNETLQHASWYEKDVQPYLGTERPPSAIGASNTGTFTKIAQSIFGGNGSSATGAAQALSGMFSGNGTLQSLMGSIFGSGSSSPLSGLLGRLSGLFKGFGGSGGSGSGSGSGSSGSGAGNGGSTGGAATPAGTGSGAAPQGTGAGTGSAPGGTTTEKPLVTPAVTLISNKREVDHGETYSLIWSATGVSESAACRLYEESATGTRQQLAVGNSSSVTRDAPAVGTQSLRFTLECTPADARVPKTGAKAVLEIDIAL